MCNLSCVHFKYKVIISRSRAIILWTNTTTSTNIKACAIKVSNITPIISFCNSKLTQWIGHTITIFKIIINSCINKWTHVMLGIRIKNISIRSNTILSFSHPLNTKICSLISIISYFDNMIFHSPKISTISIFDIVSIYLNTSFDNPWIWLWK